MEHHVGELVVAVHDAGLVAAGLPSPQPVPRDVQPTDVAELESLKVRVPAIDLALVEPVGPSQPLQAPGLPVDPRQPGDGLHQLVGQAGPGIQIREERLGPLRFADRRPPVHIVHQVEGCAQHVGVVAGARGPGVGHVGASERGQDAVLAHHGLVAAGRHVPRRAAQRPAVAATAHLKDLVGRSARDEPDRQRLACSGQAPVVHPVAQAHGVDQPCSALRLGVGPVSAT